MEIYDLKKIGSYKEKQTIDTRGRVLLHQEKDPPPGIIIVIVSSLSRKETYNIKRLLSVVHSERKGSCPFGREG